MYTLVFNIQSLFQLFRIESAECKYGKAGANLTAILTDWFNCYYEMAMEIASNNLLLNDMS